MYGYILNSEKRYRRYNTAFNITIAYLATNEYNQLCIKTETLNFNANLTNLIEKSFVFKDTNGVWQPVEIDAVPEDIYANFSYFYPNELGFNNCIGCGQKHRNHIKRCTSCGLKIERH